MSLAIFDLDNTLLSDDSDYLWGQFLVDQGIVDKAHYEATNTKFYEDYQRGHLDMIAFLRFSLQPLAAHPLEKLLKWRKKFIAEIIRPVLLTKAKKLVEQHRQQGDTLLVITATNRFITEPIVKLYGIEHLLATIPEFKHGVYTGNIEGIPCFQAGKVKQLEQWLMTSTETWKNSCFYTDSHNDLPLLHRVDTPIAVDPDDQLRAVATASDWSIISLRH